MMVTLEQIEEVLRKERFRYVRLCPMCLKHYEPCVAVGIVGVKVLHLVPCRFDLARSVDVGRFFYTQSFCGGVVEDGELRTVVSSKYADTRFFAMLIKHYSELEYLRLTERVLQGAGCDIEAEWALWKMGE